MYIFQCPELGKPIDLRPSTSPPFFPTQPSTGHQITGVKPRGFIANTFGWTQMISNASSIGKNFNDAHCVLTTSCLTAKGLRTRSSMKQHWPLLTGHMSHGDRHWQLSNVHLNHLEDLSSSVLLLQPRSSRWWDGYSSYILGHCEDINAFEAVNGWHVMTIWAWYGDQVTETTSPAFDSQWFIYEVEMMVKLGCMTSSQYDINSIWQKSHGIVTSSLVSFCQILCEKFYHINALPKNLFAVGPVFTGSTIQARIAWRNVVDVWWSHRENLDTRWGKYSNSLWVGVAVLKILFYTMYMLISHLYINYQAKTSIHAGCKLQVLDSAPFCWPTAIIQWLTATCEGFQASTINNQPSVSCESWATPFTPSRQEHDSFLNIPEDKVQTTPTPEAGCDVCSQAVWPTAVLKLNLHHPRSPHELSITILPEYSIIKL